MRLLRLMMAGVLIPLLPAGAATDAVLDPEFFRLSIEDPRAALLRGEQLLADGGSAPDQRREILNRMARAALLLSDGPRLGALIAQLEALGRSEKDAPAAAHAGFLRAIQLAEAGRQPEALEVATRAAAALVASGTPRAEAVAAAELCDVAVRMVRSDLARLHCEQARTAWEEIGDPFQLGRLHNFLSLVARDAERLDDAIELARRARRQFEVAGLPSLMLMVDDNLASFHLDRGEPEIALALSRRSLAHEVATGKAIHAVISRHHVAQALSQLGRHGEALAEVARAIAEAERLDYRAAFPDLFDSQSEIAARAGRNALVVEASRRARAAVSELLAENRQQATAEMEARYRALEKEREIERLDQENRLKALELAAREAQLQRQRIGITAGVLGLVALVVFAAVLLRLLATVKRRERELETLSRTDSLTQIANRRAFLQELAATLAAVRRSGSGAALLVLDVDHFKSINDTHGHQAGDQALLEIVARMRRSVRARDTLGRLGGEEFGVILPGLSLEEATGRAEEIRRAVATAPLAAAGRSIGLAVSVGVAALASSSSAGIDEWLGAADRSLYAAKRGGRDRVEAAPLLA